jgi:sn-glycerol 3-phosphate transport system permease protein
MEHNLMTELTVTNEMQTDTNTFQPPSRQWLPRRWAIHVLLWIAIAIIGFPLIYAMIVSTQSNAETLRYEFYPGHSLEHNWNVVINERNLPQYMFNSTILAVFVTVGKTILSLLSGLAFVYFRFPGKWIVFGFVLITLLMPTEMLIIALFRLIAKMDWGDTFWAISVPFLASATGTFLFRQHFANLPTELSEAAQMDGANPLQFLFRVLLPLSWNTIGALAVIQFVYMWNQYLWPMMIIKDERLQVVQVGLGTLRNAEGSTTYGPMMMGAVIATIPPVFIFILLQKQFMSGFAISRDK